METSYFNLIVTTGLTGEQDDDDDDDVNIQGDRTRQNNVKTLLRVSWRF